MLVVKFSHPDDKNEAIFPKIVVIFGLFLAFTSVLIMPYDIANTRGSGGNLRVDVLWQIVYVILAIMVFGVIPFAYFFYENDMDPDRANKSCCASQLGQAIWYSLGFAIVFILLLVILYAVINEAQIPVTEVVYHHGVMKQMGIQLPKTSGCELPQCWSAETMWPISVSFPIYLVAFMSFIGWFFFTMFVGVGLIALPLDFINEYRTRPKPLSKEEYLEKKEEVGNWSMEIISQGEELKKLFKDHASQSRFQRRKNRKKFLEFELQYNVVKNEHKKLEITKELKGENGGTYILWGWVKLAGGIIGTILSLTWIIHIAIFVLPKTPAHPFLNNFFIELENAFGGGFPLFGVLAFAIYSYYLLWCCVKGSFKLGLRFFIWKLYPMEIGGTLMNSFLVNTWLLLLCSVPTVQFSSRCFPVYARFTDIDMLFGTQVKYLKFFKSFWDNNVFIIVMLIVSGISLIYLLCHPDNTSKKIDAKIKERTASC